ncbi:hypothetical protein MLD38_009796 [Melastoma candidum]|uniref:Uncharacterized protein n=1 Tax=Melastoma candidum TaxID=119954 RepID=A0ACB9RYW3_9MYRT|nr:hypothetical protein MLD38_009796 [Melastoma candidum]
MLAGLSILGDPGLKTTSGGINDEDSTVSLGSTRNHVLDKVTVSRSINDGAVVIGGLELPQNNINGYATLALCLKLVEHPSVLETPLVHLSSFLLEPLDHKLVDAPQLVDQVTIGGRLPGR